MAAIASVTVEGDAMMLAQSISSASVTSMFVVEMFQKIF
jgi:hypothetical protein